MRRVTYSHKPPASSASTVYPHWKHSHHHNTVNLLFRPTVVMVVVITTATVMAPACHGGNSDVDGNGMSTTTEAKAVMVAMMLNEAMSMLWRRTPV